MSELKPFIPSWLDDANLSQAEFRLYAHLCRRADNKTGIAWPSYETIGEVCGMGRATVARTIKSLQNRPHPLIVKVGKPFGGTCQYRVVSPIVSKEELLDSNSLTGSTNEVPPIVSPENCNRSPNETPIVSPEALEGNPTKGIQLRKSKRDFPPLPFSSPAFADAWAEWQQHLTEKRKTITPLSAKKGFMDLAKMGESRAIAAINYSIGRGWAAIFEPSGAAIPTPPAESNVIMINGRTFK